MDGIKYPNSRGILITRRFSLILCCYFVTCQSLYVAPDITEVPDNQITNSSKNVTFRCTAAANPSPVINWIKDGRVLKNTTKSDHQTEILIHVYNNSGKCTIDDKCDRPQKSKCKSYSTLQLLFVQPDDNGEYICMFTNGIGSKSKSAILSVDGTPVIADPPKDQTIMTLSDTLFTCAATGYPCPNIRWIQNNSIVENQDIGTAKYKKFIHVTNIENYLSPMCAVKSTLVISNIIVDDVGNYTCSASNIVGNAITTAQLAIEHNGSDYTVVMIVGGGIGILIIGILVIIIDMLRRQNKALRQQLDEQQGGQQGGHQGGEPVGNEDDINHMSIEYECGGGQRPVQQAPRVVSSNKDSDDEYVTPDEDDEADEKSKLLTSGGNSNYGAADVATEET